MPEVDIMLALSICNLQRALCRSLNNVGGKACQSWTKYSILKVLEEEPGINIQSLAAETSLTSGSVTYAIDRLEAEGLIYRKKDSKDSRICMIYLTSNGEEAIPKMQKKLSEVSSAVFEGIIESRKTEMLQELQSAISKTIDK
ncbi:MAG TPA: MarR family transcriptional regulator [Bacillota bacterium]|nr:MarR family transcriptional regulator [Bacillota bacterium]HOG52920.1 MarR family transcriptional regulator [Bacillota bacterium]